MLVKYEFLKILRKKSILIVMAVSLMITAFLGKLYNEGKYKPSIGWSMCSQ